MKSNLYILPTSTHPASSTITAAPVYEEEPFTDEDIMEHNYLCGMGGSYLPGIEIAWNPQLFSQLAISDPILDQLHITDVENISPSSPPLVLEDVWRFVWSPTKPEIFFVSESSSGRELKFFDFVQEQQTSLTWEPAGFPGLQFIPNTEQLTFLLTSQIVLFKTDNIPPRIPVLKSALPPIFSFSWSVNNLIAYEYDYLLSSTERINQIAIIDTHTEQITFIPQLTCSHNPLWSPNGQYLAFYSFDTQKAEIFLYDITTQQMTPILRTATIRKTNIDQYQWVSNDKLAFLSNNINDYKISSQTIYIVDLQGTLALEFKTPEGACCIDSFAISPNGQYVAFVYKKNEEWLVGLFETQNPEVITDIFVFPTDKLP